MSNELNQDKAREGEGAGALEHLPSAGQPRDDRASFQPAPAGAAAGGPAEKKEAPDPDDPCPPEAGTQTEPAGAAGTAPTLDVEVSQQESNELIDDPFTPTDYTAIEKLVVAYALARQDDSLGRGGDSWRWELEPDYYEPLPTIDLIRREGSIRIAYVEWEGPRPKLTSYSRGFTYEGNDYKVPSLPAAINGWMLLPSAVTSSDSAREVFDSVYEVLGRCPFLSEDQCELLTFWCIATWFSDRLDFVPKLTISGPRHAADLLFRMMRYVCRRAILLAGIKPAVLKQIPIHDLMPTLLIQQIKPSKSAAELLDVSDHPGYFVACGGELLQFHCPKAVYLGEDYDPKQEINGLHICLSRSAPVPERPFLNYTSIECLQNRLFAYRCHNLDRLQFLQLAPGELLPQIDVIARRLGAVIVEDPTLQHRVAEILQAQSEQIRADRAGGIAGIVVQAVLTLAHRDEQQAYVRDVTAGAIRIGIEQGESLKLSSEKVGHVLKRLGLYTRRLGSAGRGLVFDKSTQLHVHRLALEYDVLPPVSECGYCHQLQTPGSEEDM
jgi:hypothetical protein